MPSILENIDKIKESIAIAAEKYGNKAGDITLVCVTKQVSAERILEAISAGVGAIGESRVEEALEKLDKLPRTAQLHMIGHLQTRKVKDAVKIFSLIHSVDSINLAKEINKRAEAIGKVQNILLEINVSGEQSKYGFTAEQVINSLKEIALLKNVKAKGLMTMAPLVDDVELTRPVFKGLKILSEKIKNENVENIEMKYLSMGMTQDYAVAIEEGSNMVRIGTGIFKNDK